MKQEVWNGDCEEFMKSIEDNSIDLVILDPPYFRILQEKWDKFSSKSEYNSWTNSYLQVMTPKVRINGTVLVFGCSRNFNTLGSINTHMENLGFKFIQEIIIDKGFKAVAGSINSKIKMFPAVSENIIVYRKDYNPFLRDFLKAEQKKLGVSYKQILEYIGDKANGSGVWGKYTGNTEFPQFPTREHWEKFEELFKFTLPFDSIKETYNGIRGLTNVWNDVNFRVKDRIHPSEKPPMLMDRIVEVYSDEGNLILDPFAGSGSTLVAAKKANRQYIGIEKELEYYNKIISRLDN